MTIFHKIRGENDCSLYKIYSNIYIYTDIILRSTNTVKGVYKKPKSILQKEN